jgi:glycosyltransferase involved in cell wall biosynthesis
MRLILSCYTLDYAGLPTYTLTLYRALRALGHEVTVYSPLSGALRAEMSVVQSLDGWCPEVDAIIAQHNVCARDLRKHYPDIPMVYSVHGVVPEIEQPPMDIQVDWWTSINAWTTEHMIACGVPASRIDLVRDFIDGLVYRPMVALAPRLPHVLFVSNYKKFKTHWRLKRACQRLGYPFSAVGAPYGRSRDMPMAINEADLVVSWGRGILEGMACGRAVMSYDCEVGDGYLDHARYLESREHNFGGPLCRHRFTVDELMAELSRYSPEDAWPNRELIRAHHHVTDGTIAILAAVSKAMASR